MNPQAQGGSEAKRLYGERDLPAIAARWDARASQWDRDLQNSRCHLNEDAAYSRFLRETVRVIRRRRRFCQHHGVIDAGCGTGLVLDRVVGSFAWGLGVDISPAMIRAARRKRISNARFLVGDVFKLSELAPRAGVVLSRGVLLSHYGAELGRELLAAARHALAQDGFVVFDFLNASARDKHAYEAKDKTYFTRQEIRRLARSAGFHKATVVGDAARRVLLLLAVA